MTIELTAPMAVETLTSWKLTLASASPRRADLLRAAGYEFEVIVPPIDEPERLSPCVPPIQQAEALSYFKARSAIGLVETGVILGADTIVALDGAVYGKAADEHDARRILTTLSGTRHQVITGVSLLSADGRRRLIGHDCTWVTMRPMVGEALDSYLASGAWAGKAGAYGIQDHGDVFIERIEGSFSNVVGLPMETVAAMLRRWSAGSTAPPAENPLPED